MAPGKTPEARPQSLVWATDLDVLPSDKAIERRDGYLAVRSPRNPSHHWGNMLLFDNPPDAGDGGRWEGLFAGEFASHPQVRHRTFAWDRSDGATGLARPASGASSRVPLTPGTRQHRANAAKQISTPSSGRRGPDSDSAWPRM